MFKFSKSVLLCALLFGAQFACAADDVQDANKLFKQGQYPQALEKVDGFLATKPKDAQARFLKGLILTEQGQTPDAIKIFTGLTDDYPELPEPYNNLAVLYAGQGQYDKAKTALEMAIRTHPTYATAHENLGDIYAKMASQAYDRALQLDKSNTTSQTKLALIKELFSSNGKSLARNSTPAATSSTTTTAAATTSASSPVVVAAVEPAKPIASQELPPANPSEEVLKAVNEWAAAWSAKNSKKYLAFYAREFKTPDGESRGTWEAQRRERIAKPSSIHVGISNAKVSVTDETHAAVTFRQSYRASHLNTSSMKTLEMVRNDGKWLIVAERSGK